MANDRVAIIGSRSIKDRDWVNYHLDMLLGAQSNREIVGGRPGVIVSGGAVGPDTFGKEWAEGEGIPVVLYKPAHLVNSELFEYDPRNFFARNKQIVDNCDRVIAFYDPKSTTNGTLTTINKARKSGKDVTVIRYA